MYVCRSQTTLGEILKYFFDNKSSSKVISSERAVIPLLKWFETPKGELAYIKISNKMNAQNNNEQVMHLQVTDGLAVAVIQNANFEFLMPTKDVALGYGISGGTIRDHQSKNPTDFIYGKHFVRGVDITDTLKNIQPHAVFWTKAGIIRLGFFIKSERAKLFRDWAESVILNYSAPAVQLPAVNKRKHNRLTQDRMIGILADIAKIDDKQLRLSLISKLGIS